jgi:hypothetical protein
LSQIAKVNQCSDGKNKTGGNCSSNNSDNISLNVPMLPSCDLLQRGNSSTEMSIASSWLEYRKPEVDLLSSYCIDTPLGIMILEFLVPVMKRLWG